MKKPITLSLIILTALLLSGCAENVQVKECLPSDPYGFFGGFWHGMISPFSFIGSLFSDDISVYAINNTGGWYDFGFLIGAGVLFSGSSSSR